MSSREVGLLGYGQGFAISRDITSRTILATKKTLSIQLR